MKKFEIENKLELMKGKLFTYNKAAHYILRYDINETRLKITTDIEDIVILIADVKDVLCLFKEVEEVKIPIMQTIATQNELPNKAIALTSFIKQTTIGSMAQELKSEVMDAIKKVKEDKNYICQAVAINEGVKQVLDIAKAEVEMLKVMDSINRS